MNKNGFRPNHSKHVEKACRVAFNAAKTYCVKSCFPLLKTVKDKCQIVNVNKKLVWGNADDHPKLQKSKCQEHILQILFATMLDSAIARSKFSNKQATVSTSTALAIAIRML